MTSWSDNAARAMGLDKLPEHDLRYEMADEYLSLMYKWVFHPLSKSSAYAWAGTSLTNL